MAQLASHQRAALAASIMTASLALAGSAASQQDPNNPGILEPVLTSLEKREVRIPNTDQVKAGRLANVVGGIARRDAEGAKSLTGHTIVDTRSPNRAMRDALDAMSRAAKDGKTAAMQAAARELESILLGTTQGRIYDGYAMLDYNRGAFAPGHIPGEYKMKKLRDSGKKAISVDGKQHTIWEVDVNYLWYDAQFDSDTFLLRVPVQANPLDLLRVHFRVYSLVREELAPTAVMLDYRGPGSVQFPFKGFDSVWVQVQTDSVTECTVDMPPLSLLRGVYTWGWRIHPPRIQFLQPVFEITNVHSNRVDLAPQGRSFAERLRLLSIDDIADAAPEKKMYQVARAALTGAEPSEVYAMLTQPTTAPRGDWGSWAKLAEDQRQLPDEAWDVLAHESIPRGQFGPYRFVTVYMNNEMYGAGPAGNRIAGWYQGERFKVKLINLDKHTHYFRNVDFGPKLHNDISSALPAGSHSFEIMNFKPVYGAPKVAELQWRAGWGFRPHFDVIQQQDVFPRLSDQAQLRPYRDGHGSVHLGYQYSAAARGGDFVFDPPRFIIGSVADPSPRTLSEANGASGLVIGRHTEGYGIAKMCNHKDHSLGGFCRTDVSAYNPYGIKNVDTDNDGKPDVLWFPPFLRNPDPEQGGDIIPPTPAWKPFLWINPANGTIWLDPKNPRLGAWADLTYSHGRPVPAGQSLNATIEAPRAAGQVFYQFDDLYHDDAIFSPHPTFAPSYPPADQATFDLGLGKVGGNELVPLFSAKGSLASRQTATFTLSRAPRSTAAVLLFASRPAPLPVFGGTLLPELSGGLVLFVTDANGQVSFSINGAGVPAIAYAQFLVLDPGASGGVGISNALRVIFQG